MAKVVFDGSLEFTGAEACERLEGDQVDQLMNTNPIKVFFNKEELLDKLSHNLCKGIRFYPALDENNQHTVVAVGVRSNRSEIRTGGSAYFRSKGNAASERLSTEEAIREDVRMLIHLNQDSVTYPFIRKVGHPTIPATDTAPERLVTVTEKPTDAEIRRLSTTIFAAYFSAQELREHLLHNDSIGLHLYLDKMTVELRMNEQIISNESFDTYTAAPVGADNNDLGSVYYRSLAPCPPDCGGGNTYKPGNFSQSSGGSGW